MGSRRRTVQIAALLPILTLYGCRSFREVQCVPTFSVSPSEFVFNAVRGETSDTQTMQITYKGCGSPIRILQSCLIGFRGDPFEVDPIPLKEPLTIAARFKPGNDTPMNPMAQFCFNILIEPSAELLTCHDPNCGCSVSNCAGSQGYTVRLTGHTWERTDFGVTPPSLPPIRLELPPSPFSQPGRISLSIDAVGPEPIQIVAITARLAAVNPNWNPLWEFPSTYPRLPAPPNEPVKEGDDARWSLQAEVSPFQVREGIWAAPSVDIRIHGIRLLSGTQVEVTIPVTVLTGPAAPEGLR